MLTDWMAIWTWGLRLVRAMVYMEQIAEIMYLAIVPLCGVQTEQVNYYSQESGQARNRVDLQEKTGMITKRESKCLLLQTTIVQR
jgi:hypothetical protein